LRRWSKRIRIIREPGLGCKKPNKRHYRPDGSAFVSRSLLNINQAADLPENLAVLAEKLIFKDIIPHFQIIELDQNDYRTVLHILATNNIEGGATYDALIAHAAFKAQAEKLLTFNVKHFKKVYSAITHIVEEPS
jgi:hypothetical protein